MAEFGKPLKNTGTKGNEAWRNPKAPKNIKSLNKSARTQAPLRKGSRGR